MVTAQSVREKIEAYAAAHPYPDLSFYQMSQDAEKWKKYGYWRVSHPLCGISVKLLYPIFCGTKRSGELKYLKRTKLLAIDVCGGIRFTCAQQYWIDVNNIDFDSLAKKKVKLEDIQNIVIDNS